MSKDINKPKTLFIVTTVYPNVENKASGIFVHDLNKMLKQEGHNVIVIDIQDRSYKYWFKDNYKKIESSENEGIHVVTAKYKGFMTQKFPKSSYKRFNKKFKESVNHAINVFGEPDLVISHFTVFAGLSSVEFFNTLSIPVINIEHHSLFLNSSLKQFFKEALIKTLVGSSAFVPVSKLLESHIRKHSNNISNVNIQTIPNMVSPDYKYVPYEYENGDIFKIFSAGNLIESKNFVTLIKAFILAFNHEENVELSIAGNGKLRKELTELVNNNNRSHQIKLLGTQSKNEMVRNFSESHLFALLSLYETFGIVYREAMVVGRPILAYKNGGISENWNDSLGILIEDNDVNLAALALREMKDNFEKYDGKKISNYASSLYSPTIVLTQINTLIEESIQV